MLTPINSIKHFVSQTLGTVGSGVVSTRIVAESVVAPATANAFSVKEGSVIKAVYIELWISGLGASGARTSFNVTLEKLPAGVASMTIAQAGNLGAYPNKKNILYTTQGLVNPDVDGNQAVPIIRQFFAIPKGKQRMGLADEIVLNISSLATNLGICGIFIFKEYN